MPGNAGVVVVEAGGADLDDTLDQVAHSKLLHGPHHQSPVHDILCRLRSPLTAAGNVVVVPDVRCLLRLSFPTYQSH